MTAMLYIHLKLATDLHTTSNLDNCFLEMELRGNFCSEYTKSSPLHPHHCNKHPLPHEKSKLDACCENAVCLQIQERTVQGRAVGCLCGTFVVQWSIMFLFLLIPRRYLCPNALLKLADVLFTE